LTFSDATAGTILLIDASRGLGHVMASEFLKKEWSIVGTVRGASRTPLHDLQTSPAIAPRSSTST
jgi:hypothetical protein